MKNIQYSRGGNMDMYNGQYMGNPFPNQFKNPYLQQSQGQQLIRVNGIDSAKAYPTQPNSAVPLFDANDDVMYIKITDASNFPTIRRFKFIEEPENVITENQYVTKDEFNKFKEELLNAQQFIQSTNEHSNEPNKKYNEHGKKQ